MARYTGPKGRVNRRLQTLIYENGGASRALEKRGNQPPGMHTRGRRPSNYGMALMEKQKIKHYYGLGERQLRRYFENVSRKKGNTGEQLLMLFGEPPSWLADRPTGFVAPTVRNFHHCQNPS